MTTDRAPDEPSHEDADPDEAGPRPGHPVLAAITIGLLTALGICLLALTGHARGVAADRGALPDTKRTITVSMRDGGKRLTASELDAIKAIPGVRELTPTQQLTFSVAGRKVVLFSGALAPALHPVLISDRPAPESLAPGELMVPASAQGIDLRDLAGKQVPVTHLAGGAGGEPVARTAPMTVVAITDPSWHPYGTDGALVDSATLLQWSADYAATTPAKFPSDTGFDGAQVTVAGSGELSRVTKAIQERGYDTARLSALIAQQPSLLVLLDVVGRIALVLALFAGAVVGYLAARRDDPLRPILATSVIAALAGLAVGTAATLPMGALLRSSPMIKGLVSSGIAIPGWLAILVTVVGIAGVTACAYLSAGRYPRTAGPSGPSGAAGND